MAANKGRPKPDKQKAKMSAARRGIEAGKRTGRYLTQIAEHGGTLQSVANLNCQFSDQIKTHDAVHKRIFTKRREGRDV